MSPRRPPWYLLTGLVLGLAAGLLYAWVISPLKYVDTAPASLRVEYKDAYRSLIASAYQASGDLGRAQARLALLGDADPSTSLAAQAQRSLADGGAPGEAQALAGLAASLRPGAIAPTRAASATAAPARPSPSPSALPAGGAPAGTKAPSPGPTATREAPRPTRTPTPTLGPPFVLAEKSPVCDAALPGPLLQVQVRDADGRPVPGVKVSVTWENGEDSFYTGLKPEVGLGYADFAMSPGTVYTLRLADGGQPVGGLAAEECSGASGEAFSGGWLLEFTQP